MPIRKLRGPAKELFKYSKTEMFDQPRRGRAPISKPVVMVFLVPGPNKEKWEPGQYICPAGPGMPPIPEAGKWYQLTDFLLRRVVVGDAVEGEPPKVEAPKPPKKKSKTEKKDE